MIAEAGGDVAFGVVGEARGLEVPRGVKLPVRRPEADDGQRMRGERRRRAPLPVIGIGGEFRRADMDIQEQREGIGLWGCVEPAAMLPDRRVRHAESQKMERLLAERRLPLGRFERLYMQ